MIYSFDYDMSYFPSIPVVEVEIRQTNDLPGVSLRAIVDSGADGTIIPVRYLEQVHAYISDQGMMRGVTQERILVDLYWIWLHIGEHRPFQIEVVGDIDGDEVILGRDVLNQFIVTLNGLAAVVEISD